MPAILCLLDAAEDAHRKYAEETLKPYVGTPDYKVFFDELETKRLPNRPRNRDTLSMTTNTAGTNTSESAVEHNSPPITAYAIGARNSPPAP